MALALKSTSSCEPWIRLNLAIELCLRDALVETLHNRQSDVSYKGLPDDGCQLFQRMNLCQLNNKELQKIFNKTQWNIICPSSGVSSASDWDITKLIAVLRAEVKLQPVGGWKQVELSIADTSIAGFVLVARNIRNYVKHSCVQDFSMKQQFDDCWNHLKDALNGLNYSNMALFNKLRIGSLDEHLSIKIKIVEDKLLEIQKTISNENSLQLKEDMDMLQRIISDYEKRFVRNESQMDELQSGLVGLTERMVSIEETCCPGATDAVVSEIWQVIRENDQFQIDHWKTLVDCFDVKMGKNILVKIWQLRYNNEKWKDECKESFCCQNVSWRLLSKQLNQMGKDELVEELIIKTNLTIDMDLKFRQYRKKVLLNFFSKPLINPFLNRSGQVEFSNVETKDAYIELAILQGSKMDERWCKGDRNYHFDYLDLPKQNISMKDILTREDSCTIISGIAGVGKSTLFEKMILEWANGQLFNGVNGAPSVQLLLYLKCSELNSLQIKEEQPFEEVLCHLFPHIFEDLDLSVLKHLKEKVLLMLDGADEFQWIDDITKTPKSPLINFFNQLINLPKQSIFGKIIITSRPRIASKLQSIFRRTYHINAKRVEICGFTAENVIFYVNKYIFDSSIRDIVLQKIEENRTLKAMVRIPIYLWVICGMFQEEKSIQTPKTCTELLLYVSLIFLRGHLKSGGDTVCYSDLKSLCGDKSLILKYIIDIAAISFETISRNCVVFTQADIQLHQSQIEGANLDDLEQTGFIVKSGNGENGSEYQFRHLVLQELFTALHIFLCNVQTEKNKYYENANLNSSLPLVAGLEGICIQTISESVILKSLMKNVLHLKNIEHELFQESSIMEYMSDRFLKESFSLVRLMNNKNLYLVEKSHQYYECLFEMQGDILSSLVDHVSNSTIEVVDTCSLNGFQVEQLLFFWQKVSQQCSNTSIRKVHFNLSKTDVKYIVSLSKISENFFFHSKITDGLSKYFVQLNQQFLEFCDADLQSISIRSMYDMESCDSLATFAVNYLQSLEVFDCDDTECLFKAIFENFNTASKTKLQKVTIREGNISGTNYLASCFAYLQRVELTKLHLSLTQTTFIASNIKGDQKLKELLLNNCDLNDEMINPLIPCIRYLRHICLCGNNLTERTLIAIGEELKSLTESQNEIQLQLITLDLIFEDYVYEVFRPRYMNYLSYVDIDFAYGEFDVDFNFCDK